MSRPRPGMAAPRNDLDTHEQPQGAPPAPPDPLLYPLLYPPYPELSQPRLQDLFLPGTRFDLDPRLAPPPPLPITGFPAFLPGPLLYGAGGPYIPGAQGSPLTGSPLLTHRLPAPFFPRIYELEKDGKSECPLPADLSTKRRDASPSVSVRSPSIKSETSTTSCSGGRKTKQKVKVPKLEPKQENEQRDDVNNNEGRTIPQPERNSETNSCDPKCQNDNDQSGALNLTKKDKKSESVKGTQNTSRKTSGDRSDLDGRIPSKSDGRIPGKRENEQSAAIVFRRHDDSPNIPHTTRHQSRDEIVMFPLVHSLRDPPVTSSSSSSYQPIRPSVSSTSHHVCPITAKDASAASAALSLPTNEDSTPKKVHAVTFTPEITIPPCTPPKTSPAKQPLTPSPGPSPGTSPGSKRVFATTFTPEVASQISGAIRAPKRTLSSSDAKTAPSPDKKQRTLSSSGERKAPRRWIIRDAKKNESVWGSRAPTSPKPASVSRQEGGKIRLAVDWKAAILGTKTKVDPESVKSEKSDEKLESKDELKPKLEDVKTKDEKRVEIGCVKSEVKIGGCLKDERPLSKATSSNIPVGIAVARQRLDKTRQEAKPALPVQGASQLGLESKPPGMTSSLVARDIKPEIAAGVIVTGGTGLVNPWPRDTNSTAPSWFQPTNQQAPTYWLGHAPFLSPPIVNNLDLTSQLQAPPMNAVVAPPAAGYKLAQDPITGQLFVIPSTNLDAVLDANRLWSTVAGQLQPSLSAPQQLPLVTNPPALNLSAQPDQTANIHDSQMTKPSPEATPVVTPAPPACPVDTKPDQIPTFPQQQNFTFANLPFYYDTNVQAEVSTIAPKTEPVAMQSRGTSPMTVASGSPYPEVYEPEAEVDIVHVETDKHVVTHNTAIQTSPDVDHMNEMREQSSQTSETEKDSLADSHADVTDANDHVIDSEPEVRIESENEEQVEIQAVPVREPCPSRRHADLQSLIRELMPLANGTHTEQLTVPLTVQVDDDRLYENSYRNLHSNLSTPGTVTPSRRWSELAEQCQEEAEMDGLDLLSSIVEKHGEEFRSPDSRQLSGCSPRLSVGSWDRCVWSEDLASPGARLASPDTRPRLASPDARLHQSPYRTSSTCSSPTFSTPTTPGKPGAGFGALTATSLDNMDASEIEMRLKLAELQRRYREKQRQLAKLQPKRTSDSGDAKPRQRSSQSCADDWKKPRKRIKKRRHSTPSNLQKQQQQQQREQQQQQQQQYPQQEGRKRIGSGLAGVTRELFAKPLTKGRGPGADIGLTLLANAAATDRESRFTPGSPSQKCKTPSPRKLSPVKTVSPVKSPSSPTKPVSPVKSPLKSPQRSGVKISKSATKRRSEESRSSDDDEKKRAKSAVFDDVWAIRRSERIFLSDSVPPAKPEPKTKTKPKSKEKPKPKEDLVIKREIVSPVPSDMGSVETSEISNYDDHIDGMSASGYLEIPPPPKVEVEKVNEPKPDAEKKTLLKDESPVKKTDLEQTNTDQSPEPKADVADSVEQKADPELEKTPDFHRSDSNESSESDNLPLSALAAPKTPVSPPLKPVLLEDRDLIDGLRILLFMEDLFYPALLKPIQPPDIYGVTVIGGRGSNRPRIMTQEELLREAIFDCAPSSRSQLIEGARVCAYWSQKFRCLYPGTVAGPDSDEEDDLTELEKEMIYVEFDDGDSGRIPFDHIRMLPADFPEIGEDTVRYPLLACGHIPRPPTPPPPHPPTPSPPPPKSPTPLPEPEPLAGPDDTTADVKAVDKEEVKPVKKKKKSKDHDEPSIEGEKKKKKKKKEGESESLDLKKHKHKKKDKDDKHKHKKIDKDDNKEGNDKKKKPKSEPNEENKNKKEKKEKKKKDGKEKEEKKKKEGKEKDEKKKKKIKVEKLEKNGDDAGTEDEGHDVEAEGQSRMAGNHGNDKSFLPAQQLWGWSGKGNKRYGVKGKVRKTLYKAISRDGEMIKVGECAVFMSTGRPHLPYVGEIESFWESWSGAMCVRVKWFYHPEETKTSKTLKDMQGALYQTAHRDDNDVQTISHKCDVLPLAEYKKAEREEDSNDVYYLAGKYDPIGGAIDYEPGVE